VRIVKTQGLAGAAGASGAVVVIDVLRAFTVSAYALAGGATRCLLVRTVEQARALAARIPGSLLSAEIDGLPVPGIPISNSPTAISRCDLRGRVLVQRTSAGTQAVAAVRAQGPVFACSFVVAAATARRVRALNAATVTLVASGQADHLEDVACADYLDALLRGTPPDLDRLLAPLEASERFRRLRSGEVPGFPETDLQLALDVDRFDFAMRVRAQEGAHEVLAERTAGD
jgi:2-phosphosulfolactate phosphatase